MNKRYIDAVEIKLDCDNIFKVSNDAFKPLCVMVIENGSDKLYFYFEDVDSDIKLPKNTVSIKTHRTMETILDGYRFLDSVVFEGELIHLYIKRDKK